MSTVRKRGGFRGSVLSTDGLTTPPISGFLRKRSRHGLWQQRWFQTNNRYLNYFKNDASPDLLASINLQELSGVEQSERDIVLRGERDITLRAESPEAAENWVALLTARRAEVDRTRLNLRLLSVREDQSRVAEFDDEAPEARDERLADYLDALFGAARGNLSKVLDAAENVSDEVLALTRECTAGELDTPRLDVLQAILPPLLSRVAVEMSLVSAEAAGSVALLEVVAWIHGFDGRLRADVVPLRLGAQVAGAVDVIRHAAAEMGESYAAAVAEQLDAAGEWEAAAEPPPAADDDELSTPLFAKIAEVLDAQSCVRNADAVHSHVVRVCEERMLALRARAAAGGSPLSLAVLFDEGARLARLLGVHDAVWLAMAADEGRRLVAPAEAAVADARPFHRDGDLAERCAEPVTAALAALEQQLAARCPDTYRRTQQMLLRRYVVALLRALAARARERLRLKPFRPDAAALRRDRAAIASWFLPFFELEAACVVAPASGWATPLRAIDDVVDMLTLSPRVLVDDVVPDRADQGRSSAALGRALGVCLLCRADVTRAQARELLASLEDLPTTVAEEGDVLSDCF